MSLKQEIETWVQALQHYDNNEFEEALKAFEPIQDTSKILFNSGVIHATLGEHQMAIECYQRAVRLDQYFAVAYFQQGVSNFLLGDFEEALANFNDTLLYLRGNSYIDYDQLGLKFKLYSCEVLFNRGLCYIYLQQKEAGMQDFSYAVKEKVVEDHNVIDEAIREEAEGYTVFSIPVGIVYRPNDSKVKNLKTKDYLGKARLIAASDRANAFTDFAGSEAKMNMSITIAPKDDRPTEAISFAASNLVKPGLQSRVRQQSEPPVSRNVFPPTPPPEADKPASNTGSNTSGGFSGMTGRAASVRSGAGKPDRFDNLRERPRMGTMRTASEPRGPTRSASKARLSDSTSRSKGTPLRRKIYSDEEDDEYPGELYDMYNRAGDRASGRSGSKSHQRPRYIDEEEEYASDAYEGSSLDEDEFEIVNQGQRRKSGSRAVSRKPEIRKIRVKVHAADDTRYVMIGTAVEFQDLADRIRGKFGLRSRFKIKMRDDDAPNGDMITMGDQDDLDMAITSAKSMARKERSDMGKIELWVQETN